MHTGFVPPAGLFAIHLADGVLTPAWQFGGFAAAALLLALSVWRIGEQEIVRVGLFTAAFFVASQVHVPAGVGTVHLMLNGVVGVVLRRFAPLAIAEGLLLQALLFGHGGYYALGVNAFVLSIPALLAGYGYARLRTSIGRDYSFACGLGVGLAACLLTLLLNAAALAFGGREDWRVLVVVVVVAHLPVVAVEALLTGVVVRYLERVKPEWLGRTDGTGTDHSPSGNTSSNGTSH
jgi:cobalt/nickel transport system permease protein